MKGLSARALCAALLIAVVIAAPADKPKKNLKKYLYKKQGPVGEPFLPMPLKTKSNSYPATLSKLPRGERSYPSVVYISDSPDDEAPEQNAGAGGGASSGITDFFDRISRTFGRAGHRESELINIFPGGDNQDDEAQYDNPAQGQGQGNQGPFAKPTAFPAAPIPSDHLMNDEEGQSAERDEEDSGSEEDQEENEEDNEEDEEGDNEDDLMDDLENGEPQQQSGGRQKLKQKEKEKAKQKQKQKQKQQQQQQQEQQIGGSQLNSQEEEQYRPVKVQSEKLNKNKPNKNGQKGEEEQEENQEESEEEEEENDEEELDIPDNVPPFIRQSIIEEHKKKKQQEAQGGGRPGGPGGAHGHGQQQQGGHGPGRPDGMQQGGYGRPGGYGQAQPQQDQPSGGGGFLSSLLG